MYIYIYILIYIYMLMYIIKRDDCIIFIFIMYDYYKTWLGIANGVVLLTNIFFSSVIYVATRFSRSFKMRTSKRAFHKSLGDLVDHCLGVHNMRKSSSGSSQTCSCSYSLKSSLYKACTFLLILPPESQNANPRNEASCSRYLIMIDERSSRLGSIQ